MPATPQTQRKILFFHMTAEKLLEKRRERHYRPIRPSEAIRPILDLPVEFPSPTRPRPTRYLEESDGTLLSCDAEIKADNVVGKIARTRMAGLPLVDRSGSRRALNLRNDEGLYEPAHFVWFPDHILGIEANFYGPRIGRLTHYLELKAGSVLDRASYALLLGNDPASKVQHMGGTVRLEIRAHRSVVAAISERDADLGRVFRAAAAYTASPVIGVEFSVESRKRKGFNIQEKLQSILGLVRDPGIRQGLEDVRIVTEAGTTTDRIIDLLQDDLVAYRYVSRTDERHRSVDENAMQQAIIDARRSLDAELTAAVRRVTST